MDTWNPNVGVIGERLGEAAGGGGLVHVIEFAGQQLVQFRLEKLRPKGSQLGHKTIE